jgi:hypothetical protein
VEATDMTPWRTSSYSSNGGATCVEVASQAGRALVRDTTDRDGATLALSANAWSAFTSKIKNALRVPNRGRTLLRGRPLCVRPRCRDKNNLPELASSSPLAGCLGVRRDDQERLTQAPKAGHGQTAP